MIKILYMWLLAKSYIYIYIYTLIMFFFKQYTSNVNTYFRIDPICEYHQHALKTTTLAVTIYS